MDIEVKVHDRILKPLDEVFAAVIDPRKMSHYFISGASGPMETGATVDWEFADVGATVQIHVLEVEKNRRIVYEAAYGGKTRTSILFDADSQDSTVVTIKEATFPMTTPE